MEIIAKLVNLNYSVLEQAIMPGVLPHKESLLQ